MKWVSVKVRPGPVLNEAAQTEAAPVGAPSKDGLLEIGLARIGLRFGLFERFFELVGELGR